MGNKVKKERRAERERQKAEQERKKYELADVRMEHFVLALRFVFESWQYGILAAEKGEDAGWNKEKTHKYKPLKVPDTKTAFWVRMQTAKLIAQANRAIVELIQDSTQKKFVYIEDVEKRILAAEGGAAYYMPLSPAYEKFIVATYVMVAAFQDAALLMHDTHEETAKFRQMALSFVDKLLPVDSWMVSAMNLVYWECRDWMQCFPAERGEAWYSPDLISPDVETKTWKKAAETLAPHGERKKIIDPETHKITWEEPWFTPEWAEARTWA